MADDPGHSPRKPQRSPDELADLRRQAVRLFMVLSVAIIVLDSAGRLFRDPAFHIDPVVFGLVFGTLLALLGLEGINRVIGK